MRLKYALAATVIALFSATGAQATIITKTYTAHVVNAPYSGTTGIGSFTYDDSILDGGGNGIASTGNGLTLTFTLFGQTFTQSDDTDFPDYPQLTIVNFTPTLLDFQVWEHGANPVPINQPGVEAFYTVSVLTAGSTTDFDHDINVDVVPEPATSALFGIGLAAFFRSARRQRG